MLPSQNIIPLDSEHLNFRHKNDMLRIVIFEILVIICSNGLDLLFQPKYEQKYVLESFKPFKTT